MYKKAAINFTKERLQYLSGLLNLMKLFKGILDQVKFQNYVEGLSYDLKQNYEEGWGGVGKKHI